MLLYTVVFAATVAVALNAPADLTMIDFNIERFNEKLIPVDPEGDRGEHRATEEHPGSWHGTINYTLQGGAFGFAGHGEQRANPFWASGHGANWQTVDQNADR